MKAKENEWISVNDRLPKFDEWVLVYCGLYGIYIGSYQRIPDTNWGNWNDGKDLGVLPPLFWMPLPPPPYPNFVVYKNRKPGTLLPGFFSIFGNDKTKGKAA